MITVCTGTAILKTDVDGKKYWCILNEDDYDAVNIELGVCLKFNPEVFAEGAEIRIIESVEGIKSK